MKKADRNNAIRPVNVAMTISVGVSLMKNREQRIKRIAPVINNVDLVI